MDKQLKKILIGITKDNEILELEIKNPKRKKDYFSISGNTARPITRMRAKKQTKEFWEDYLGNDEIQEMNERMGTKFRSPKQAGKYVRDVDGELHGFDNSTMTDELRFKGKDWLFESSSAGQIRDELGNLKKTFVKQKVIDKIKRSWDADHLKIGKRMDMRMFPRQNREKLLKKAIREMMK